MGYRFMRIIVFFDLPVETIENKRNYRKFRKFLISNGYIMMQESVYTKILITQNSEKAARDLLRKNRPPNGLVQTLTITEKQFSKMEFITGSFQSEIVNSDQRLVIL